MGSDYQLNCKGKDSILAEGGQQMKQGQITIDCKGKDHIHTEGEE
jgi:hypothetical protein